MRRRTSRPKGLHYTWVVVAALVAGSMYALSAQAPASDGPQYASGTNNLLRPDNYREWIFIGAKDASAAPLSGDTVKRCIDCHTAHTAVERTFVQFYPTLIEVAKKMGTVKKDYTDP